MFGPNGQVVNKLTWEEYTKWQRWDEFPERAANPPLTVETSFFFNGCEYMVTSLRNEYVIVEQPSFNEIICNKNFLDLLNMPFINDRSFKDLIPELLFEV